MNSPKLASMLTAVAFAVGLALFGGSVPQSAAAPTEHPLAAWSGEIETGGAREMNRSADEPRTGYAPVNGLDMYYEIHGTGQPLVLLHGTFSAIGTSFGTTLPGLAAHRRVIAVDLQGHGRTADIERPLRIEHMADDTAALLRQLGIKQADVYGYSMGASVGLALAVRHPDLVRKLVVASVTYNRHGAQPGLLEGLEGLTAEALAGTPWQEEYARIAPHPENWPRLIGKYGDLLRNLVEWSPDEIRAVRSPVLIIIGDSDLTVPEHAVDMFRLLGGGVFGDTPAGLPNSQLAVLPGTSHVAVPYQTDLLLSIITRFLDKPIPAAK